METNGRSPSFSTTCPNPPAVGSQHRVTCCAGLLGFVYSPSAGPNNTPSLIANPMGHLRPRPGQDATGAGVGSSGAGRLCVFCLLSNTASNDGTRDDIFSRKVTFLSRL